MLKLSSETHPADRSSSRRGWFISIEGGEGCGKTTLARILGNKLQTLGIECTFCREPGGSLTKFDTVCQQLRKFLLDPANVDMAPKTELFIFLAARAQNLAVTVLPALQRESVVICDRFTDSTLAYQAYGRNLPLKLVEQLCALTLDGLNPDLTVYLDLDPEVGLQRVLQAKGIFDRFDGETLAFHKRVRQGFQALAELDSERICTFDAAHSPEILADQVLQTLKARLKEFPKSRGGTSR